MTKLELQLIKLLRHINDTEGSTCNWSKHFDGTNVTYEVVVRYPWRSAIKVCLTSPNLEEIIMELGPLVEVGEDDC